MKNIFNSKNKKITIGRPLCLINENLCSQKCEHSGRYVCRVKCTCQDLTCQHDCDKELISKTIGFLQNKCYKNILFNVTYQLLFSKCETIFIKTALDDLIKNNISDYIKITENDSLNDSLRELFFQARDNLNQIKRIIKEIEGIDKSYIN